VDPRPGLVRRAPGPARHELYGLYRVATASRCRDDVDAISVSYYSSDRTSSWYPAAHSVSTWPWHGPPCRTTNQDEGKSRPDVALGAPLASLKAYMHLPLLHADEVQTASQFLSSGND